jgi:hypothetical protein
VIMLALRVMAPPSNAVESRCTGIFVNEVVH